MTLTSREIDQIEAANASGRVPVVFLHDLWLLASSWDRWRDRVEQRGYASLAPGWAEDITAVPMSAGQDPRAFAEAVVQRITDHHLEIVERLAITPAVVGHGFGGLLAQRLAGLGAAGVTVAIEPAPFRGVLPVPPSWLRASAADIGRAVTLGLAEFRYAWANALGTEEAHRLYDEFVAEACDVPLFQAVAANLNPFADTEVGTNAEDRGPLLLISGEKDNTVPWPIVYGAHRKQSLNPSLTQVVELAERGHSLTIDHGWELVADTALGFIAEHHRSAAPAGTARAR